MTPASMATIAATVMARTSSTMAPNPGRYCCTSSGTVAVVPLMPSHARPMPRTPPATASSMLSVNDEVRG